MRDPIKAKARSARYRLRKKIERYGVVGAAIDMRGRHGNHARGPQNGQWNSGTITTSHGYVLRRVPIGHHRGFGPPGNRHRYAYEHDLLMEEFLGRKLLDNEVVHHRNGVRNDNRLENLEVKTRADHAREHVDVPGARNALGQFTDAPRVHEAFCAEVER